jgi:hypothetical protein
MGNDPNRWHEGEFLAVLRTARARVAQLFEQRRDVAKLSKSETSTNGPWSSSPRNVST